MDVPVLVAQRQGLLFALFFSRRTFLLFWCAKTAKMALHHSSAFGAGVSYTRTLVPFSVLIRVGTGCIASERGERLCGLSYSILSRCLLHLDFTVVSHGGFAGWFAGRAGQYRCLYHRYLVSWVRLLLSFHFTGHQFYLFGMVFYYQRLNYIDKC